MSILNIALSEALREFDRRLERATSKACPLGDQGPNNKASAKGPKKEEIQKKLGCEGKTNRFSVKISIRYPFQLLSYQAWRDLMTVAGWWNPFMFTDVDARGGELYPFKNLEAEPLGLKVSYTRQTTLVSRTVSDWDVCLSMFGS